MVGLNDPRRCPGLDVADPLAPRLLARDTSGHTGAVVSVDVDPSGKLAATSSIDQTVILWDLADPRRPRRPLRHHPGATCANVAAFAPVGAALAVGGDGLTFWDVTDPAHPRQKGDRLAVPGNPPPRVRGLQLGRRAVRWRSTTTAPSSSGICGPAVRTR